MTKLIIVGLNKKRFVFQGFHQNTFFCINNKVDFFVCKFFHNHCIKIIRQSPWNASCQNKNIVVFQGIQFVEQFFYFFFLNRGPVRINFAFLVRPDFYINPADSIFKMNKIRHDIFFVQLTFNFLTYKSRHKTKGTAFNSKIL